MTRLIASLILALCALLPTAARSYTVAEVPDVHRADRTRYVADPDGYIDPDARAALDVALDSLRRRYTVEPIIVVVGDMTDNDIDNFATELFTRLGLGKADKDNGLLIVAAMEPRTVAIRTGYGLEGVLPDITCGRIIRGSIAPAFSKGDYGAGLAAAVADIATVLNDSSAAAEVRSQEKDVDRYGGRGEDEDGFAIYVRCSIALAVIMLIVLGVTLLSMRGRSDYDKYVRLSAWRSPALILGFAGLGIPFIAVIPLLLLLRHWRDHKRQCPNCGTPMVKLDEIKDNSYLSPSQDLEERLGSVDYDVWLCPKCGETDVLPYINKSSDMVECENCHARTARLTATRILRRPTATVPGIGVRQYECLNCHHRQDKRFDMGTDDTAAALGAAAVLGAMSGRRSGGFGGGFGGGGTFGGGFGGGLTGGGGASGSW